MCVMCIHSRPTDAEDSFNQGQMNEKGQEWEPLMDMGEVPQGTTLADIFPRIDCPLRMDPPTEMKAPVRHTASSKDEMIRQTAFSPAAFRQRSQLELKVSKCLRSIYIIMVKDRRF